MIRAILELKNSRLSVQCENAKLNDWREITSKDQQQFQKWINSYRHVLQNHTDDNRGALLHIGGEIYQWLNGAAGWLDKFFKSSKNPPFILEFNQKLLQGVQGDGFLEKSPPGNAFLEVPWELLADKDRHLAENQYLI